MKALKLVIIFSLYLITFFAGIYVSQSFTVESDHSKCKKELKEARKQIHYLEKESKELKDQLRRLKSEQVTKIEPPKADTPEKDESVDAIVNSALAKKDLSLADVIAIYQRNKDRKMSAETRKRLDAYYYVSDILINGDEEAVKGLMDPKHETLNQLSETHKWNVLAIGWGTQKDGEYAKLNIKNYSGKDWGNKYFINSRNHYPTFFSLRAFVTKRNFKNKR